eukprot:PhM_4_TR12922/c4_g1_i1/m.2492
MPRPKPFSGKQKKQQQQAKREARREKDELDAKKEEEELDRDLWGENYDEEMERRRRYREKKEGDDDDDDDDNENENDEENEETYDNQKKTDFVSATTNAERVHRSLVVKDTDEDIMARKKRAYKPIPRRVCEECQHGVPKKYWFKTPTTTTTAADETDLCLPLPPMFYEKESVTTTTTFGEWVDRTARQDDVTYFEANEEIWKQLKHATDAAHVVACVVDVRYVPFHLPTLFLREYVQRQLNNKPIIVILNKVDLVPESVCELWRQEIKKLLSSGGCSSFEVVTFTCQPNLFGVHAKEGDDTSHRRKCDPRAQVQKKLRELGLADQAHANDKKKVSRKGPPVKSSARKGQEDLEPLFDNNNHPIDCFLGAHELREDEARLAREREAQEKELMRVRDMIDNVLSAAKRLTGENDTESIRLALIGQPNVGKSSIVNALLGTKHVSVSATPGHTKTVQTLLLPNDGIIVYDTPGLIFPATGIPRALGVIAGIFPFAQNREHFSSVGFVAERVPLEKVYHLKHLYSAEDYGVSVGSDLDPWSSYEISEAVAVAKGFFLKRGHGRPDAHRGAHHIMVDVYTGKIALYFIP